MGLCLGLGDADVLVNSSPISVCCSILSYHPKDDSGKLLSELYAIGYVYQRTTNSRPDNSGFFLSILSSSCLRNHKRGRTMVYTFLQASQHLSLGWYIPSSSFEQVMGRVKILNL